MTTRIIFNGQEYPSTDAMPEEVRKSYLQALAQFADNDRNGIPDVLEGRGVGNVIGIQHASITVNGKTYENVEAMPTLVRLLYDYAMGQANANRTGGPDPAAGSLGPNPRSHPVDTLPDTSLMRALEAGGRTLEQIIQVLAGIVTVAVLAGAAFVMLQIGPSRMQERLYIAVAALLILGLVDSQVQRLVRRRAPLSIGTSDMERRYAGISLLLMLAAAAVLIGLALLLP